MRHLTFTAPLALGMILTSCSAQAPAPSAPQFSASEIQGLKEVQARSEIMQLVNDYAVARDAGDAEGYGNVFAPDGKFNFGGRAYVGPKAIGGRIKDAPTDEASLHMLGGSQIEILSPTTAKGRHYVGVYVGKKADAVSQGGPIPVAGPEAMGIYTDEYVLTDAGWKIAERSFQRVFTAAK